MKKTRLIAFAAALSLIITGCGANTTTNDTAISTTASVTTAADTEITTTTTSTTTTTTTATTTTTTATTTAATTTATADTTETADTVTEPAETEEAHVTATTTEVTTVLTSGTTTAPRAESEPDEAEFKSLPLMQQYEQYLPELQQTIRTAEETKDMPAVHITTKDRLRVRTKEYVDSVIDVFNCDESMRLTAEGGVKVRGNSTAEGSEKPYRIKFTEKQNMLGLHDGMEFKSWVLLRSQWNLIPDFMGFSLAETIFEGRYYSSDCTYVNLYMNGRCLGLYLLCEQNQATKGRVDVYEPSKDENGTDIGYFVELDNYANEDEDPFFTLDYDETEFTDFAGTTQVFSVDDYSIKSDINNDAQRDFIAKYIDGVFWIMYEAVENGKLLMFDSNYDLVSAEGVYSTPKEAVAAVLDLDSVVNTMILQELVHNYDVGAGSFFMAVDFSEDSDYEKLTFLAPWDFNWAYSEETHGRYYAGAFQRPVHDMYDRTNAWLTVIMKADWFRDMLKEKWARLTDSGVLTQTLKEVLATAQTLESDLGNESWRIDSAKDIVSFVRGRINWLDTQWGEG